MATADGILMPMTVLAALPIVSWHAHVYFDPAATRAVAERARSGMPEAINAAEESPIVPNT
jgi:aromatic ring-cleaving dioxygenase